MTDLSNVHDTSGGQEMGGYDALPAGEYVACLAKSERREAKAGNGNAYINMEFEVTDGPAKGRRFFGMLNLWNQNAEAVEIANRELNSICNACGKLRSSVGSSEELHGIPMIVKLTVKDDQQYGPKNVIKGYKPLNSMQGGPARVAGNAAGDGQTSAPWRKSAS